MRSKLILAAVATIALVFVSTYALGTTVWWPNKGAVKYFNATRLTASGGTQYLTGSNAVIYAFPQGVDSAGQGTRCRYLSGTNPRYLWAFVAPKTDVYYFMETTGIDTLISGMDSLEVTVPTPPDTLIQSASNIRAGVILTQHLANSSVTEAKLAPGAVTATKIAAGAISDTSKFASGVIPLSAFKRTAANRIALPSTLDMRAGGGTDTVRCTYIVPVDSATGVSVMYKGKKAWLTVSGLGLSSDGSSGLLTRARTLTSWSIINTDQFVLKMPNRAWYILSANADSVSYFDAYGNHAFTVCPDSVRFYMPVRFRHGHK